MSHLAYLHVCISCTIHTKAMDRHQSWQAQAAKHMTCVSTTCRLEEDLPPEPFPTCTPTLPLQNAEHPPPAGTRTTHPTPLPPPPLSPPFAPIPAYSAPTPPPPHPPPPPLCRLTGPQGTFLLLRHHPLSSKGSPRRHACHTLQ